jgi:YD repeat-containing protein
MKTKMKEITEYDKNGNLIHRRYSNGFEYWCEYDKKNNEIHSRDSEGCEWWSEYDENSNEIHRRYYDGHEWWGEYDENNNEIHSRDSDGLEHWCEYDEKNNLIHFRDSNGDEYWYDEDGNEIEKPITPTQEHTKMSVTITLTVDYPNHAKLTLSIPADCQITEFLEHCKTVAIGMGFHHSKWDEAILEHAQTIRSIEKHNKR